MKVGLVWFKNDLRVHDNEALFMAASECDQLIFCYCVEPYQFERLDLGFRKTGINRFKFLEQSVLNLQKNLELLGGHLIIAVDGSMEELPRLVKKFDITSIYAEEEYAHEELEIVTALKNKMRAVEFNFYWGKTLYHIDDIPFTIDEIPLTSKAYRIPTSKQSSPRKIMGKLTTLNAHPEAFSTKFPLHNNFGFSTVDYNNAEPFMEGGEDAALVRLQHYSFGTEQLTSYRWTRNKSDGLDYSSKFSPYLALGCLSAREIYRVIKKYESEVKKNQSTWWLVFELVWRDYFTFKGMRFGNKIFFTGGIKDKPDKFENDKDLFFRWCEGATGIPFIDAHMRQLNQTGFMSNRGRVNCASYFVHDLKVDWTWGAAYFESRLIDYDVSANWLNWHVQAYEIYYTNPVHQSLKYKANDYIAKWIEELAHVDDNRIHTPWLFEEIIMHGGYPKPAEIFSKWTRSINRVLKSLEE